MTGTSSTTPRNGGTAGRLCRTVILKCREAPNGWICVHKAWADYTNDFLERNGSPERIDHRSNAERGIDEIPTVHMGVAACQMEKICLQCGACRGRAA